MNVGAPSQGESRATQHCISDCVTDCINRDSGSRLKPKTCPFLARPDGLSSRVTDGARTRALWSHNPPTSVSERCRKLQNPLRQADFFAGGCLLFLRVALAKSPANIKPVGPAPTTSTSVTESIEPPL